jgi:stress-induced morphogen
MVILLLKVSKRIEYSLVQGLPNFATTIEDFTKIPLKKPFTEGGHFTIKITKKANTNASKAHTTLEALL